MYRLIFLILALSGFLLYKALSIRVARKSPSTYNFNSKPAEKTKPAQKSKVGLPTVPKVAVPKAENPEVAMRAQFDSLAEVFREAEPVDEDKLTPQEREVHESALKEIQRIEEEARPRLIIKQGAEKSYESLTPEEKKAFDVYKKFETNGEKNETK